MNSSKDVTQYLSIIQIEAYKCYMKLKKPPIYDVEDLEQEGIIVWLYACMFKPDYTELEFRPYFRIALINRFNDILTKSYRYINQAGEIDMPCIGALKPTISPLAKAQLTETLYTNLSPVELNYISTLFNLSEEEKKELTNDRRHRFSLMQKKMNLTTEQDFQTTKNIERVLTNA